MSADQAKTFEAEGTEEAEENPYRGSMRMSVDGN
jgi:hypothetical protein